MIELIGCVSEVGPPSELHMEDVHACCGRQSAEQDPLSTSLVLHIEQHKRQNSGKNTWKLALLHKWVHKRLRRVLHSDCMWRVGSSAEGLVAHAPHTCMYTKHAPALVPASAPGPLTTQPHTPGEGPKWCIIGSSQHQCVAHPLTAACTASTTVPDPPAHLPHSSSLCAHAPSAQAFSDLTLPSRLRKHLQRKLCSPLPLRTLGCSTPTPSQPQPTLYPASLS